MISARREALCSARRDVERDGRSGISVKSSSRPSSRLARLAAYAMCFACTRPPHTFFF
jgi:hypothetical protein